MHRIILFLSFAFLLSSCNSSKKITDNDQALKERANSLAQKYIITDGHVDLPYRLKVKNFRLEKEYMGIPVETNDGDFDFKRAKIGGLDAPFMSIFIPANLQKESGASYRLADSLINMVTHIANELPEYYTIATTPTDVKNAFEKELVALPMGMENGSPIESDIDNVDYWRSRGISYITLTHSKDNQICDSSYDNKETWGGLSPFGKEVVKRMNEVGIMIDVSHISDLTFYQVMELTQTPVIASHSSCRKFIPGFERNMSDDMLKILAKNGGVIQINFGSTFIDEDIRKYNDQTRQKLNSLLDSLGLERSSDEAKLVIDEFQKDHPRLYSTVEKVVDHIDHAVAMAGIDHVGFGSDFDGVGDSLPTGIKDVSQYPNIIYEMLKRGYSEQDIEKVCYLNVFRVWNQVLDYADNYNSK